MCLNELVRPLHPLDAIVNADKLCYCGAPRVDLLYLQHANHQHFPRESDSPAWFLKLGCTTNTASTYWWIMSRFDVLRVIPKEGFHFRYQSTLHSLPKLPSSGSCTHIVRKTMAVLQSRWDCATKKRRYANTQWKLCTRYCGSGRHIRLSLLRTVNRKLLVGIAAVFGRSSENSTITLRVNFSMRTVTFPCRMWSSSMLR